MKKTIFAVLCLMLQTASIYCSAQQSNDADVPDKVEVLRFLDLIHTKDQMVQTLAAMSKQMRISAEEGFKQKVPNATPEQLAKVDQLFDGLFAELPVDEMISAIVPIYQAHFTKSDLNAIETFYLSPTGQKMLKEMPAVVSESMQAGGDIGRRIFKERSKQFDEKVADLVNEAAKTAN